MESIGDSLFIIPVQLAIAGGIKIKGIFQSNKYRKLKSLRGYTIASPVGTFAVVAAKKIPQDARDSGRVPIYTLKPGAEIRTAEVYGTSRICIVNPDAEGRMMDILDVFRTD